MLSSTKILALVSVVLLVITGVEIIYLFAPNFLKTITNSSVSSPSKGIQAVYPSPTKTPAELKRQEMLTYLGARMRWAKLSPEAASIIETYSVNTTYHGVVTLLEKGVGSLERPYVYVKKPTFEYEYVLTIKSLKNQNKINKFYFNKKDLSVLTFVSPGDSVKSLDQLKPGDEIRIVELLDMSKELEDNLVSFEVTLL